MLRLKMNARFDPAVSRKALLARWQQGLPTLAARVLYDCNRYARDDTGRLIGSSAVASNLKAGKLVWATSYAKRVYYTGAVSHAHNQNASLRWCQRAMATHLPEWQNLAIRLLGGD